MDPEQCLHCSESYFTGLGKMTNISVFQLSSKLDQLLEPNIPNEVGHDLEVRLLNKILREEIISTRKLDRGLCLSRTKNCADYDSRGFEPATTVVGQATLKY